MASVSLTGERHRVLGRGLVLIADCEGNPGEAIGQTFDGMECVAVEVSSHSKTVGLIVREPATPSHKAPE